MIMIPGHAEKKKATRKTDGLLIQATLTVTVMIMAVMIAIAMTNTNNKSLRFFAQAFTYLN